MWRKGLYRVSLHLSFWCLRFLCCLERLQLEALSTTGLSHPLVVLLNRLDARLPAPTPQVLIAPRH